MGVPISEVGYTSATTGTGDHEVHKGHVVALAKNFQADEENYIMGTFIGQGWLSLNSISHYND
jgi:hypothetical protein